MRFETLNVAVLTSRRAPAIENLLRHPARGRLFDISAVITSEQWFPQTLEIERNGVPVLIHPIRGFCDERGAGIRNREARIEYDTATATMLDYLGVDTVLCLGYLYVLSDRMLKRFPDRILNIHDSDLTICDAAGRRKYTGLRATRDAIIGGEDTTRSTVHIVTAELDGGPIIAMSEAYTVPRIATDAARRGDMSVIKPCAWMQRQAMMNDWGDLAARALEYVAAGVTLEVEATA